MTAVEITPEATRRPDVNGVAFRLAGGRVWHLATPVLYLRPTIEEGRVTGLEERSGLPASGPPGGPGMLEAFNSGEPTFARVLILAAAVELLMLCHDVGPEVAAEALELDVDESEDLAVGMLRMFRGERPSGDETERDDTTKDA